ncbi:hypothetical protein DPMN_184545 [Dreissena polymorpha]|uniref:Uncharacterized protein n=1 Tax=Dreissena polymorpha TaxID=45954 RepID=A0A9D4DIS2_DREPO|nr:hypothetical protein DPMN_184545 [Dreissena polymorpha]
MSCRLQLKGKRENRAYRNEFVKCYTHDDRNKHNCSRQEPTVAVAEFEPGRICARSDSLHCPSYAYRSALTNGLTACIALAVLIGMQGHFLVVFAHRRIKTPTATD